MVDSIQEINFLLSVKDISLMKLVPEKINFHKVSTVKDIPDLVT